jgi:hypothetical protein
MVKQPMIEKIKNLEKLSNRIITYFHQYTQIHRVRNISYAGLLLSSK